MANNYWSDVSSISNSMLEAALFVVRESYQAQNWITMRNDMSGLNPRNIHTYNQLTVSTVNEADDLVSQAFTPSLLGTLTPAEIAGQVFITDSRRDSDAPEDIIRDSAAELAFAVGDTIEGHIIGDFASLTGGTVGTAGSTITWGYVSAAIAQARNANKSPNVPLVGVLHGYQAAVLAKTASVAGATSLAQAPGYTDAVTRNGLGPVFQFMGVPIYQVFQAPDSSDDFRGAVFPRNALMIDWRQQLRLEPDRDPSRRGTEFNVSAIYAHGVYRPTLGVSMIFDASAPTS